jgi:spermidine/putrescine transport system permease protein
MLPARIAQALRFIEPSAALYPSNFALAIGMVSNSLPFAVLPLYTNVEKLDWALVEASRDLYASPVRVFFHAIFPQTLPGLVTAVILTFIPAMGAFVIPDLLGGGKNWMLGNLIQHQFGVSRDFPFGAAVSLVLTLLTLAAFAAGRGRGEETILP